MIDNIFLSFSHLIRDMQHSDYRAGGRAHAVRGRKLVVSMVCTVANYEYAIYWNFHMVCISPVVAQI